MTNLRCGCTLDKPCYEHEQGDIEVSESDSGQVTYPCEILVDFGERCGSPITCVAREPFTPAAFATDCCETCAESFASQGYAVMRYCPGVSETCDTEIPMKDQLCKRCQQEANGGRV